MSFLAPKFNESDSNSSDIRRDKTSNEWSLLPRQLKRLDVNNHDKFLENWNPETSNRETRKMTRKTYSAQSGRRCQYDENGAHIASGLNLCDCLTESCPGCHYPCPKCNSPKCGHECRIKRKWTYETLEVEGTDLIVRNPMKQ